jgi:hypothetical protein
MLARLNSTPPLENRNAARARTAARSTAPRQHSQLGLFSSRIAPPRIDPKKLTKLALGIWGACGDPRGSMLAASHFTARGIALPDDVGTNVLRFHRALTFGDERAPGLLFLLRDVLSDERCGVLRLFLAEDGSLIGRRLLGRAYSAAISADEDVATGLHIAPDVESALAGMNAGLRPMWALPGARALADFPVLGGIEELTINIIGDGGAEAAARWSAAGREVLHVPPRAPP